MSSGERAVLSAIELNHFFCKYRFVYIYFTDKIITVLYIVKFYAEQHTGARCESLNERRSSVLLRDEESDALHEINDYIYKDTEYKYFGC